MQLAKVLGQVVSTVKEPGLDRFTLLLVQDAHRRRPRAGQRARLRGRRPRRSRGRRARPGGGRRGGPGRGRSRRTDRPCRRRDRGLRRSGAGTVTYRKTEHRRHATVSSTEIGSDADGHPRRRPRAGAARRARPDRDQGSGRRDRGGRRDGQGGQRADSLGAPRDRRRPGHRDGARRRRRGEGRHRRRRGRRRQGRRGRVGARHPAPARRDRGHPGDPDPPKG